MSQEIIIKNIEIKEGKFISSYIAGGHYEYEIDVTYENENPPNTTVNKRYREMRDLYKKLLLYCPGSLIPKFPEKNALMNVGGDTINKENNEKRYLGLKYFFESISKNENLRKNKNVLLFFNKNLNIEDKDDLKPLEGFINIEKNKGILASVGNAWNYTKSLMSLGKKNEEKEEERTDNIPSQNLTRDDINFIEGKKKEFDKEFEKYNKYYEVISRQNEGTKDILANIEGLIESQNSFNDNLKKILEISQETKVENENLKKLTNYSESQKKFVEKYKEKLKELKNFNYDLEGLLQIYERKEKHFKFLGSLNHEYNISKKEKWLDQIKQECDFIKQLNKDFIYELERFKEKENYIYKEINSFFKQKYKLFEDNIKKLGQLEEINSNNINEEEKKKEEEEEE